MWNNRNEKVVDERIVKENNCLAARMYYVVVSLTVVSLIIKIICKLPIYVYGLEIIALVISILYLIVNEMKYGILFVRKKSEELLSIHNEILAHTHIIIFWIIIVGELLFLFVAKEYFFWVLSYLGIWLIPALIITTASVKNGWLIWGSKKKEIEGKKKFKKRVVYGALFFGVIVGFPELYHDNSFHAEGVFWILGLGVSYGIAFYRKDCLIKIQN